MRKLKKKRGIFKRGSVKKKILSQSAVERKALRQLERIRAKAFTKPRKRKGWFGEHEKHALVAKGIEVKGKELKKYKYLYSIFILVSLVLAVLSLITKNLLSFTIALIIMLFSFIYYRATIEKNQQKYAIYIFIWPFSFILVVASIMQRNFLAFALTILAMFLSSFAPTLINQKMRRDEIMNAVRELQKSRKSTETDFDKLLVLLQQFGKLKISEIAYAFEIDRKKAEEWARIMEENGIALLHYPAFGEEELRKKELKGIQ
jgi:hypothetical protein